MHEGGIAHRLVDEAIIRAAGKRLARVVVETGPDSDPHPEILGLHLEAAFLEHGVEGVGIEVRVGERRHCALVRVEAEPVPAVNPPG